MSLAVIASAQTINDPIANAEPGHTYYKWTVDINHDGTNEIMLGPKKTSEEVQEEAQNAKGGYIQPNVQGFGIYIPQKSGGYIVSQHVESPEGDIAGGIGIDLSHCYVGYVDEIKGYGIVSLEIIERRRPDARVLEERIYCYTIKGDHVVRRNLTKWFDVDERNNVYDKYLSEGRRTKVILQQIVR
jgi:hypothetical protein